MRWTPSRQFFDLSTSALDLIHGIMSRSFRPTSSIGCASFKRRVARLLLTGNALLSLCYSGVANCATGTARATATELRSVLMRWISWSVPAEK